MSRVIIGFCIGWIIGVGAAVSYLGPDMAVSTDTDTVDHEEGLEDSCVWYDADNDWYDGIIEQALYENSDVYESRNGHRTWYCEPTHFWSTHPGRKLS